MELTFKKIKYRSPRPTQTGKLIAYLCEDNWDDYDFKTSFYLIVSDEYGTQHNIGNLRLGIVGLEPGWASEKLPDTFRALTESAFTLGQDEEYYKNIRSLLSDDLGNQLLEKLKDVAYLKKSFDIAVKEKVF